MVYQLLELILSEQVHTEDNLMEKLDINEHELEALLIQLEELGYLIENNSYFEATCDTCSKNGNCSTENYEPNEKVKKIRVITHKALDYAKQTGKLHLLPKKEATPSDFY